MEWTVKPLLTGMRELDQGIMTYLQGYGKRIYLPIYSFLLTAADGMRILVDTGLEDVVAPEGSEAATGLTPLHVEEALAAEGLTPGDIQAVVNTHLHEDHCGNNALFPHARFYIGKAEVEACRHPHPLDPRYEADYLEGIDVTEVEAEMDIAPGVRVIPMPGHTLGGLGVRIESAGGGVVIPGFCCSGANFPPRGPAVCPGVHCDAYLAYDNAQMVKSMGVTILPLHELSLAGKVF